MGDCRESEDKSMLTFMESLLCAGTKKGFFSACLNFHKTQSDRDYNLHFRDQGTKAQRG